MSLFSVSLWLILSELSFNLSGYIIHAFLGRFLGPAEYGRFGIIITFSTMIVVLIGRGIPIAMSKYLSEIKKKDLPKKSAVIKNIAFKEQLKVALAMMLLYWLLTPVFSFLLKDQSLLPLFRLSSLVILTFSLASFFVYYYNGIEFFGRQAFLKFTRTLFRLGLVISLGFFFQIQGAIWGQILAPLFVFLFALVLDPFKKNKVKKISLKEKKLIRKKLLHFAWPVTLFLVFYELMISLDLYLVKAVLQSDTETGIYNAALTVGRLPYYAFYFLTFLILPKISHSVGEKTSVHTQKIMTDLFRFLVLLLLPTVLLTSFFAPSLLDFFYGQAYFPATSAMRILAWGVGFLTVFHILVSALNGSGKNKVPMWLALFGMLTNAILNFWLIQKWGIIGSAWATTLIAFFTMLLTIFYTQKKICFFINLHLLFQGLFFSGIIFLFAHLFSFQHKFLFIPQALFLLALYLFFFFLFGQIKKDDYQRLFKKPKTDSSL